MSNKPFTVVVHDFNIQKAASVRLLIAQIQSEGADWVAKDGLFFYKDADAGYDQVDRILSNARQSTVDLVILPELSVPENYIEEVQAWSRQTGSIVVAGSHYHEHEGKFIARSPIIIGGKIFFTQKLIPAPMEVSPIEGEGLTPGEEIAVFKNTSVGNFAVLICSDYLDTDVKHQLLAKEIDILCVPAFQRKSTTYHSRMSIDCEESEGGIYIAYSNMLCDGWGDGHSAFFGLMDTMYTSKLHEFTDSNPQWKICELDAYHNRMIIEVDLQHKKPYAKRTVHDRPNIKIIQQAGRRDNETSSFVKKIAHDDERYARIKELFVEPNEYLSIIDKLNTYKLVFIIGDPGIGKTYTAVRLLRHYFESGYEPVWYTGLEKSERFVQRQILENFRPKDHQVIYFEDPFGRTTFEKRDTIYRIFGPLADNLTEVNARVIITSRKEIFEQFNKESLTSHELLEFIEEMNIVKPSYSSVMLKSILGRLAAGRCKWYGVDSCRELVEHKIDEGKLNTPLAIRDFVFSTENVLAERTLAERIDKRVVEAKVTFSQEMMSCSVLAKLALSLIFLFGRQSQATLAKWFSQAASFLDPTATWGGTSPFLEEVRHQLGYRIEQYGYKGGALRFVHPNYEEAFVETAIRDTVTFDVMESVAKLVARQNLRIALNGVLKNSVKYPVLTLKLLKQLIPVLKIHGGLTDESYIGGKLLAIIFERKDMRFMTILNEVVNPSELIKKVNAETNVQTIGAALRFVHNYGLRLSEFMTDPPFNRYDYFNQIEWQSLFNKLKSERSFSNVLMALEWIVEINYRKAADFLHSFSERELLAKFGSLQVVDQLRFIKLIWKDWDLKRLLLEAVGRDKNQLSKRERREWIWENAPEDIGVVIDDGAVQAIQVRLNLLPAGIVDTVGEFERGDLISIFSQQEKRVAAGHAMYSSEDITVIRGQHSSLIDKILGYDYGKGIVQHLTLHIHASAKPVG